jgi:TetR/AcrR family transcriptional repressor of lmrAB and yxaGH operons
MPAKTTTRERMLDSAAELLRRQGYAATGWREVVAESATPWGSQWHHFPGGKEQLAAEALTRSSIDYLHALQSAFGSMHPADAVLAWSRGAATLLERSEWTHGCPLATVTLEMAHDSDVLAQVCDEAFAVWTRALADAFAEHGLVRREASRLATVVLAAMEGALLLARARRNAEPLRTVAREMATLIRERLGE